MNRNKTQKYKLLITLLLWAGTHILTPIYTNNAFSEDTQARAIAAACVLGILAIFSTIDYFMYCKKNAGNIIKHKFLDCIMIPVAANIAMNAYLDLSRPEIISAIPEWMLITLLILAPIVFILTIKTIAEQK